jgi:dTDP-glucose 4,6-dehydratase
MKLLVTGSAGFIGSAFVRMLLGQHESRAKSRPTLGSSDKIVSLDALTYAACLDNLAPVSKDPRHVFVKGDIGDRALVDSLVREHKIDGILNFAAESHVDRSIEGSEIFARTNVMGTLNLLEVARTHGLRYLQVSTDEVYGALGSEGSFTEETPLAPNSPYSASKAAADCFVRSYFETHKLEAIITRCSNNYGPYQFPEKFLPLAITRLMNKGKIPVYGQGLNVRDWIHVDDHAEGVWLAYTQGRAGQVYNFGGYGERKNIDMAKTLIRILGRNESDSLEYVSDRKGHDFRYSMDPKKASNELGWQARWPLDEGLQAMVEWYKARRDWWEPKLPR